MIHHGKNLQRIANEKGLNKTQIAKMLGKTSQSVDYDFKREVLNIETLKKYSQVLEISLDKIQMDSKENPNDYMAKYYKAIEELNYLKGVLLKNGIRVDMPNFNRVSSYATV
ncbi:helix-turn-helix domain-containing protein [Emticicia sp. 17c]|uniref:helix-turn-helix domain-containing protein n=1 Tax=Emticicia sp. 17c TaxID=3127704 RepID=UPI00301DF49B